MAEDILKAARRNNVANGVTGMLIVGGGCFFQVLEGPDEMVQSTFDRISRDPRHRGVITLWDDQAEERLFAKWTMGWCQLPISDRLSEEIVRINSGATDLQAFGARSPEDPANILLSVFLDSLGR